MILDFFVGFSASSFFGGGARAEQLDRDLIPIHHSPMVESLGDALDAGWRLRVYCRRGRLDHAHKSTRECKHSADLDVTSLVWTRGRDFPISQLASRLKCPLCGNRRITVAFEPPSMPEARRA
jgi:hypothetical protein